jgi:hypothetical protein
MEIKTKHAYITAVLLGAVLAAGAMFAFPLQTASATGDGDCENDCENDCGCPDGGSTTQTNNNNNQASATATGINVGVGDINVGPLI